MNHHIHVVKLSFELLFSIKFFDPRETFLAYFYKFEHLLACNTFTDVRLHLLFSNSAVGHDRLFIWIINTYESKYHQLYIYIYMCVCELLTQIYSYILQCVIYLNLFVIYFSQPVTFAAQIAAMIFLKNNIFVTLPLYIPQLEVENCKKKFRKKGGEDSYSAPKSYVLILTANELTIIW